MFHCSLKSVHYLHIVFKKFNHHDHVTIIIAIKYLKKDKYSRISLYIALKITLFSSYFVMVKTHSS